MPSGWPVAAIRREIGPLLPGLEVEVLARIDSTNSELMRRARAGDASPVLLVAEVQSAGRGRLGRQWRSGVADSLTFSLAVTLAPRDWSGLSLAVGIALAESLHPQIRIKWPNDLWWQGRKLAGILVETLGGDAGAGASRHAVIGAGINVAPGDRGPAGAASACLQEALPGVVPADVLRRVASPLVRAIQAFEERGFAAFRERFGARDALRGREITVHDGPHVVLHGTACGVDSGGALLVHTAAGMKPVSSHEVSVRTAPSGGQ